MVRVATVLVWHLQVEGVGMELATCVRRCACACACDKVFNVGGWFD